MQSSEGTFGEVWLAKYQKDKDVAVKKLKQMMMELDETTREEFEREVEFLQRLRHENIVFFYGAGQERDTGVPFLVTEFMHRGSLTPILYDTSIALDWARRTSFALDAAQVSFQTHTHTYSSCLS